MQTKQIKIMEPSDVPELEKELKELCSDYSIDIEAYPDDYDNLPYAMENLTTREAFEEMVDEAYRDTIYEEQYAIIKCVAEKLKERHPEYDDISDSLYEAIQEYVWDNVPCEYPLNDLLKHKINVNLYVKFHHSTDAENIEFDYTTLSTLLKKMGYVQTKTTLKELAKGGYKGNDKFLISLQNEMLNAYKYQYNYLCFIGKITVEEYYQLLEHPRNCTLTFDHNIYCGFVDPINGGGSVLGLEIPFEKPIVIRGDTVFKVMVERMPHQNGYTVDSIYGLTSKAFQDITVNYSRK